MNDFRKNSLVLKNIGKVLKKLSLFIFLFIFSASSAFASKSSERAKKRKLVKSLKKEKVTPDKVSNSKRALWFAHALREKAEGKQIKNLELSFVKLPVFLMPTEKSLRPLIKLKFKYDRKDWVLYDGERVPLKETDEENEYLLYAFLNSRVSTVKLFALGPEDELEEETVYVYAPEAREFKTVSIFDSVIFSLGYSYLLYEQSTFGSYDSHSIYLGLKYSSPEKGKKWGFYADAGGTLFTLESSPIKRNTNYLEADLGASYAVKLFKSPKLRSRLRLGISTANLYSFEGSLGFTGLFGLSLGLRTEYFRSGTSSIVSSLALTPYDTKDILNNMGARLSVDYNINLRNLRKAQVGLSYTNVRFSYDFDDISSNLVSLYFGLSF